MSEAALAASVVGWLRRERWEVWQEVAAYGGQASVADIMAWRPPLLLVVEVKKSLSLEVIAQALDWRKDVNQVAVAVPAPKPDRRGMLRRSKGRFLAERICRERGVGILEFGQGHEGWRYSLEPRLNRHFVPSLRQKLLDYLAACPQDYAEAGNAESRFWSPFKQTCDQARRHVAKHPGCSLKELVDGIVHHYASDAGARSSLAKWIKEGKVPGIEIRRNGRLIELHPVE